MGVTPMYGETGGKPLTILQRKRKEKSIREGEAEATVGRKAPHSVSFQS